MGFYLELIHFIVTDHGGVDMVQEQVAVAAASSVAQFQALILENNS